MEESEDPKEKVCSNGLKDQRNPELDINREKTPLESQVNPSTDEIEYMCVHRVSYPETVDGIQKDSWRWEKRWHSRGQALGCSEFPDNLKLELTRPDSNGNVPRNLKALEAYIDQLRQRMMGAEVAAEPYESLEALYEEHVKYYSDSLKLDPLTPYLFASYTLLTQQTPNLDFIFELYITGLKGAGKSTAGEHLEAVCYQGFKTGCATFPFLVRANEVLNGMTQVLDEFDLIAKDDHVTKYLRGSSDRNNPYGLVEAVSIGGQTYNMPAVKMSFGPRILITTQPIYDEMVRDRAVETVMMQYASYLPAPPPETVTRLKAHLRYYREQVKLTVTDDDKRKWYDAKQRTGRLNEIATLLYLATPEKYHPQIKQIIQREWEKRTQLERESYAAKVVEALTNAVNNKATVESTHGETCITIEAIKAQYDLIYSDKVTGKGKTSPRAVAGALKNLGLKTADTRIKDETRKLIHWPIDKDALVRCRQTLYLDDLGDIGDIGGEHSTPLQTTLNKEEELTYIHRTSPTSPTSPNPNQQEK